MGQRRDPVRRELLDHTLVSLFGTLSTESYREIEEYLEVVHLRGGERLFSQGDPGDSMFMVMGGRLRAVGRDDGGGERMPGEISRGESVGEMGLITGEPRSAGIEDLWIPFYCASSNLTTGTVEIGYLHARECLDRAGRAVLEPDQPEIPSVGRMPD